MKTDKRSGLLRRGVIIYVGIVLSLAQFGGAPHGSAQNRRRQHSLNGERVRPADEHTLIERAMDAICAERALDPHGSFPIDEMAAHPTIDLTDPRVKPGKKRAERLLPAARELVPSTLNRLAAEYNLEPVSRDWIVTRAKSVRTIKAEEAKHDNASWRQSEPHAIILGTVFLVALRSDEAMITVLAHEITHAVDGPDHALRPLFMRVGAKASQVGRLPVRDEMATELLCEMVGIRVMREYAARAAKDVTPRRRLARALGKGCVRVDLADETHLSPRQTLRLLFTLEPQLAQDVFAVAKNDLKN